MDKLPKYIKMSETAEEVQEILKNKFDYRRQGYCTQHKCFVKGDYDGSPFCPVFIKKWNSMKQPLTKKEEAKFGFSSSENCENNKKWIGLPYQDQLQDIYLDFLKKQLDSDEVIYMPGFVVFVIGELKMLALAWNRDYTPLESFEQLLLLLIMIQVFNKRWDDEEEKWIKCRENWWYVSKEFLKEVEEKIDREEKENAKSN